MNRNRCEGKGDGGAVCPSAVFFLGTLPQEQRAGVRFIETLNGSGHTWQPALLVKPEARPRVRAVRSGLPAKSHHPCPRLTSHTKLRSYLQCKDEGTRSWNG